MLLQQLSRVTSSGRFIPVVDGLRFIAIMAVVLYHLEDYLVAESSGWDVALLRTGWLHRILHVGNAGVLLFFTISGFILTLPFADALCGSGKSATGGLKRYYLRRVTRLEPPYLINLAVLFILLVLVLQRDVQELLPHLLASVFYVHTQVYGQLSEINFVAWSLEIEVQFYVLAPLLARVLFAARPAVRRSLIAVLIGAFIAWKMFALPANPRIALSLFGVLDHFLTGMLLADLYVTEWRKRPDRSWKWDLVSLVVWPSIVLTQQSLQTSPLLPALTFIAYTAAFRGVLIQRLLTQTPIVIVGGMCYTIYLYHFYIISFVGRYTLLWTDRLGYAYALVAQALLIVPVIIAGSGLLFWLFERPFMVWRPWLRARPEVQAPEVAARTR